MVSLQGLEEGQLAFKGATSSLHPAPPVSSGGRSQRCVLFDLGGRSTEFALGEHCQKQSMGQCCIVWKENLLERVS